MEKYERQYIKDRRIEDLVKEFASGFFNSISTDIDIGIDVDINIIGIRLIYNDDCLLVSIDQTPYLFNYCTIFIDKNLNMVNKQLYKRYIGNEEIVYCISELHDLVLQTFNLLISKDIKLYEHEDMLEFYGINVDILGDTEYKDKQQLDMFKKLVHILQNFDKYLHLYKISRW